MKRKKQQQQHTHTKKKQEKKKHNSEFILRACIYFTFCPLLRGNLHMCYDISVKIKHLLLAPGT